ncbi:unnamed protein product [Rotaria sp. Silwood2]|nr:unnamed protein product [Rotaria sp. Silwood2]
MSPTESDTTSHILIINRTSGLKLVVQALLSSLRPIGHIVINCCIFFIIFGNVGLQALLILFVLSSKDGWVQIMYNAIDAVDVEMQPIRNYSEAKSIYFISFISIVSFFVLNMFVGIVVKNFRSCQAQQELEEEARKKAKRGKKIERKQRLMREFPYYAHFSLWRKRLHDLCISKYFDLIIVTIIVFNVVTIWNQLDSFIVLLSIASIIIEKMVSEHILPIHPTLILLKLLKMAKGVRALFYTAIQVLPQVKNLSSILSSFLIFGTLGVELFGKLECSEEQPSLLTLFRVATGDNWNGIMKDTLRQNDSSHVDKNRFMKIISPIYFVVFVLMAQFVLINIVVAVLMKKLEDSNKMIADDTEMNEEIEQA